MLHTHQHTDPLLSPISSRLSITLPPLHTSLSLFSLYFLNCSFPPYSNGSIGTNAVDWLGGKVPSISLSSKHHTHTKDHQDVPAQTCTHRHTHTHTHSHTHTHLPQALGPLLHVGSGCVDVVLYAVNLLLLGLMHRG